jgi:hypothetical protein
MKQYILLKFVNTGPYRHNELLMISSVFSRAFGHDITS